MSPTKQNSSSKSKKVVSFSKRSDHKRSDHKRSDHKRSDHKRSDHKRSDHKLSDNKHSFTGDSKKGDDKPVITDAKSNNSQPSVQNVLDEIEKDLFALFDITSEAFTTTIYPRIPTLIDKVIERQSEKLREKRNAKSFLDWFSNYTLNNQLNKLPAPRRKR